MTNRILLSLISFCKKRQKAAILLLTIVSVLLFWAGSCSSYHVAGYIDINRTEINVQDSLFMEAVVTDEVQPSMVMWDIYPVEAAAEIITPVPGDEAQDPFKAVFLAQEPGDYQVSIRFFHKNTAPKASDTVYIRVLETEDR